MDTLQPLTAVIMPSPATEFATDWLAYTRTY